MKSNFEQFEQKESIPQVETVRVAIFYRGKFLVLQKSKKSKNPNAIEFPGGKIDNIKNVYSTEEEQMETAIKEVAEETNIDISKLKIERIEDFNVYFETADQEDKGLRRKVHLFLARIPDDENLDIKINTTLTENGQAEDNHANYSWLTPEKLIEGVTTLETNPDTGKKTRPLSRNSRHIKKLLTSVGHL